MLQPGRQYIATSNYRYGFNGKENDNEVKGDGNSLDFGARIYDPRIGRWLSLDPLQKKYPGESNYTFVSDNPILYKDADGREKIITITLIFKNGFTTQITKTDPSYFKYHWDQTMSSGRDIYKSSVYESYTIDLSGSSIMDAKIMFTSDEIRVKDVSLYQSTKMANLTNKIGRFLGLLSKDGDNSNELAYGYRIYGNGHDMEPQKGLPTAAPGTESIDMGDWFGLVSAFSPNEEGVYESVKNLITKMGGLKGNDIKQVVKALDIIVDKTENISEVTVKILETAKVIKDLANNKSTKPSPNSAKYCLDCSTIFFQDSNKASRIQSSTITPPARCNHCKRFIYYSFMALQSMHR